MNKSLLEVQGEREGERSPFLTPLPISGSLHLTPTHGIKLATHYIITAPPPKNIIHSFFLAFLFSLKI